MNWIKYTKDLLNDWGLTDWNVVFSKADRTYLGQCRYETKQIALDVTMLEFDKPHSIKETILHELAHALDYELNGKCSGHGQPWQDIAFELGCFPGYSWFKNKKSMKQRINNVAERNKNGRK